MRLTLIPLFGWLLLAACDSKPEPAEEKGALQGEKAFPVAWTGLYLPPDGSGQTMFSIAMLADSDFAGFCEPVTDINLTPVPTRQVTVGIYGPPATGTFEVGATDGHGPGYVAFEQRSADGGAVVNMVGTSGSIHVTTATADRLAGSFDVELAGRSNGTFDGTKTHLSGTFDAPFCVSQKYYPAP